MNPLQRLGMGRSVLTDKLPFFAPIVMGMRPVEMVGEGMAGYFATDEYANLYWNREFLEHFPKFTSNHPAKLVITDNEFTLTSENTFEVDKEGFPILEPIPIKYAAMLMGHETLHLAFRHHQKGAYIKADAKIWNFAADITDNDTLVQAGFQLIPGSLTYDSLPKSPKLPPRNSTVEKFYAYLKELLQDKTEAPGSQSKTGAGSCGGCCTGGSGKPEDGQGDPSEGSGGQSEGQDDSEEVDRALDLESNIDQAMQAMAKHQGKLPYNLEVMVREYRQKGKINWRQVLRDKVRRAIAYSPGVGKKRYDKPHRRFQNPDPEIITARQVKISPVVACVVDTSGSVTDKELEIFASEVHKISKINQAKCWLIQCDAKVQSATLLKPQDTPPTKWKGRGGTDFRPAFAHLDKLVPRPEVCAFLTDAEGPAPAQAPRGMKVIWVILNESLEVEPYFEGGGSFGEFIHITQGEYE